MAPQTLIFDADDTLWENNVLFERVMDDYLVWLAHPSMDGAEIRRIFAEIQAGNIATHGYGVPMFLHSLGDCFERLRGRPATAAERAEIEALGAVLTENRVELIAGVAETLAELGGRHELFLLTKGGRDAQQRKVDASGLAERFRDVHIVPEKDVATYQRIAAELALVPERSWMIGNSVKSDILPARAAGLNAVFIPNEHTWVLEHEELDDEHVLRLEKFPDLLTHF
ncbi:HAD family hydrolase [Amycolatopsis nigrescens]|uniref:HAD family hydrolase n=1 Tax=Amycolatopsis nigrescens TaxID=381445 RepID=UPI00037B4E52|nr:HAD family hydrolase [Amycolatopsis nigrescens]